jgi:hypothetical protein
MVEKLENRDPTDFLKNPRIGPARVFLARSPSWSLMKNKFVHFPWYRFYHINLRNHPVSMDWNILKMLLLICNKENLPGNISIRIINFAGENRLQRFSETVNEDVDVDFWDTFIFAAEVNEDDDVFAEEETE